MFHYLFTNDLRISRLDEVLVEAGQCFSTDTVPSANEDKNANNNMNTLGFYFNLTTTSNCAKEAANGNVRKVVLNFIKKFQFPNPRTSASYRDSLSDGIKIAPMRIIVQVLYIMSIVDSHNAYLSKKEIADYIFFNEDISKNTNFDVSALVNTILSNRDNSFNDDIPDDVHLEARGIFWKQCRRQVREIVKVLTWTGCIVEDDEGLLRIKHENLTTENKADLFDIITYNQFWCPNAEWNYSVARESYQQYMDIKPSETPPTFNEVSSTETNNQANEGQNILLYGVPGCGKSHTIKTEYCSNDDYMERVVFHPDYTYSDFIGQILPKTIDGEIRYVFEEGPFTRILKKANDAPDQHYYLIVEEINRGNAPAIFGDLFQLLDRQDDGESEYGVTNYDIARVVYGDENHKVTIPSNLSILATMNTADQNVFTLDTAFKRRWIMKGIKNDIATADHANEFICGTNLTWRNFAEKINRVIISKGEESLSSEDNRLGAYFVKPDEIDDVEIFANKVLLYLWNDAFKYNHTEVFPGFTSLEDLLDGFMAKKFDVFNTDLFDFQYTENDEDSEPTSIIPSVEQYLENKDESLVETYGRYIDELKSQHPDISLGATNDYIKAMGPSGQIFAEIHILMSQIKVNIKKPDDNNLLIGTHKPTTGWSLDYEIRFNSQADLKTMVAATLNSYNQIEG